MNVKETLTRWSRAYMEPSLFYVPQKTESPPVSIIMDFYESFYFSWTTDIGDAVLDGSRAATIVGAIYTEDGRFIERVTPKKIFSFSNDLQYQTSLAPGTYIYKEAISPQGCLLADDTVFTVKADTYNRIIIKHHRNGFNITTTTTKRRKRDMYYNYNKELFLDYDYMLNSSYQCDNYYSICFNYLSLYDNSLIRKIENNDFKNVTRETTFDTYGDVILKNQGQMCLVHEAVYRHEKDSLYKYKEKSSYNGNNRSVGFEFNYNKELIETPRSQSWSLNDYSKNDYEKEYLGYKPICGKSYFRIFSKFSGRHYIIHDNENYSSLSEPEWVQYIEDLSSNKLKEICEFAFSNSKPRRGRDYTIYDVFFKDGKYYATHEECGYHADFAWAIKVVSPIQYDAHAPSNLLLCDTKDIPNDLLMATRTIEWGDNENGEVVALKSFTYQKYFIDDYKEDTSTYFHGIKSNMTRDEILNDSLIQVKDNGSTFTVFTREFTNEKLLAEINNYIKDGE